MTGLVVLAPLPGVVRPLEQVPDDVFAQAMVGPGVAIDPHREGEIEVVAPVAGTVVKVHPHAVALEAVPSDPPGEATTAPGAGSGATEPSPGGTEPSSGATEPNTGGTEPSSGSNRGRGVLVHLGIDTIKLDGEGFTVHVEPGQQVRPGELLISWRTQVAIEARHPVISPVLALGAKASDLTLLVPEGETVDAGDALFRWQ